MLNKVISTNTFVIREDVLQKLIKNVDTYKNNEAFNYQIVLGSQGNGKSFLLYALEKYCKAIEVKDTNFKSVFLPEEQMGVYRPFDLWLNVLKKLNVELNLLDIKNFNFLEDHNQYLLEILNNFLITNNNKLVLFLENFDKLVLNFSSAELKTFWKQCSTLNILIVASSCVLNETFWNKTLPSKNKITLIKLGSLKAEAFAKALYNFNIHLGSKQANAIVNRHQIPINVLSQLIIITPKIVNLLSEALNNNNNFATHTYLVKIIQKLSTVYKSSVNTLTPQLKKIVIEMALLWENCSTKQLVEKCFMPSKLISANLKTLVDKGFVKKYTTTTKNNLYALSDRTFNLWIILTQGSINDNLKIKQLIGFLELWDNNLNDIQLSKNQIDNFIIHQATASRDTLKDNSSQLQNKPINKLLLTLETNQKTQNKIQDFINNKRFDKAIYLVKSIDDDNAGVKNFMLGYLYNCSKKFDLAVHYLKASIQQNNLKGYNYLALMYKQKGQMEKAEQLYLQAIKNNCTNASFNLAILYEDWQHVEKAKSYYLKAIDQGNTNASNNLALIYENEGDYGKAEKFYTLAIKQGDADGLHNLGLLYDEQKAFKPTETKYVLPIKNWGINSINNASVLYYFNNINKDNALLQIKTFNTIEHNQYAQFFEILVSLWHGIEENIEQNVHKIITKHINSNFHLYLIELLVQKQSSSVQNLFYNYPISKAIKQRYSIIYYVTLLLTQSNSKNVIQVIPLEIKATVKSVLNYVLKRQVFYGYRSIKRLKQYNF